MPTPLNIKLQVIAVVIVATFMGTIIILSIVDMWHKTDPLPPCTCVCTNK